MTSLKPREPYNDGELAQLYPQSLELQQVQVLLRHGERTPVSARFQNTGLAPYWPYCQAASRLKAVIRTADATWDTFAWTRALETLGEGDRPVAARGPKGETTGICQPGELTDLGRQTTLALGQRLRHLYVDQVRFLPGVLTSSDVRLRSTPIQRALESVQQTFLGLYPVSKHTPGIPLPTVVARSMQDETLFPNEGGCKRFGQLAAAFADRAAQVYNDSPEMAYINKRIGKWMPAAADGKPQAVRVDSRPRLSGIMDTINSTLAHDPSTRLPPEFYDPRVIASIDQICTEEWFAGYQELEEYRKLGIGALIGDLTQNMVEETRGTGSFKISLAGCHDTTIAASLAALGCFDPKTGDKWPPYTSSIAFELFRKKSNDSRPSSTSGAVWPSKERTWWYSLFAPNHNAASSARSPLSTWTNAEQVKLEEYYVRIRYNDRAMTMPYCKQAGRHLAGDPSFCTLTAFKMATDQFVPHNWKEECRKVETPVKIPSQIEPPPGITA